MWHIKVEEELKRIFVWGAKHDNYHCLLEYHFHFPVKRWNESVILSSMKLNEQQQDMI